MSKKILVIEDDQSILYICQQILETEGYEVITSAGQHNDMLEKINSLPDLILLDLWLPEDGGEKICKLIKSQEATKRIPVVLLSAHVGLDKIAEECSADDFIEKPFKIDDLLGAAKKYLNV